MGSLETWQEVHSNLCEAVRKAREAVSFQKAQRRYWLEEICANLDEEGKLSSISVWNKPNPLRTNASKNQSVKRKRKKELMESTKRVLLAKECSTDDSRGGDDADEDKVLEANTSSPRVSPEEEGATDHSYSVYSPEQQQQYNPRQLHGWGPPVTQHHSQTTNSAQRLHMMASVAVAPTADSGAAYHHHPLPPQQHHDPYEAWHPPSSYKPARNYSSIQDVASDEDDSDQDRF